MAKKEILINGQWQGGGNKETLYGARAIADMRSPYDTVPVSEDPQLEMESGIIGYKAIRRQISDALRILEEKNPDTLITIGGGCDADIASIAYMNRKHNGKLSVIWFDAHGDLNSPDESISHLFYGMSLRTLLGECDPISELIPLPLSPKQIIHIGGRDFDKAELEFIENII